MSLGVATLFIGAWVLPTQQKGSFFDGYDLSPGAGVQVKLPRSLEEISGLATTPDGRLFAHNDERAVVFEIDRTSWELRKVFSVGLMGAAGDFEGFAIAGERFFLLTSAGYLLEFEEGDAERTVGYQVHNLQLRDLCEMEGLAVDLARDELLLPCKNPHADRLEDHIVVFSLSLTSMKINPVPRIFLPLEELEERGFGDKFHPSAVEVVPESGSVILVAAREEALLELSPSGEFISARELKRKAHPQPEGVALLEDGTLVLADEGQGKRGTLTRYRRIGDAGEGGR